MSKNKKYIINNIDDTLKFAYNLAKSAKPLDIFCLNGDLGVGKTVIAKGIGKFFNVKDDMISPTFNIVKTYNADNKTIKLINHFDLYRIKNISELENIGFEEYIYNKYAINIIEWPEIARDILPKYIKWINIEKVNGDINKRIINYDE